jgi:hypothetical protein
MLVGRRNLGGGGAAEGGGGARESAGAAAAAVASCCGRCCFCCTGSRPGCCHVPKHTRPRPCQSREPCLILCNHCLPHLTANARAAPCGHSSSAPDSCSSPVVKTVRTKRWRGGLGWVRHGGAVPGAVRLRAAVGRPTGQPAVAPAAARVGAGRAAACRGQTRAGSSPGGTAPAGGRWRRCCCCAACWRHVAHAPPCGPMPLPPRHTLASFVAATWGWNSDCTHPGSTFSNPYASTVSCTPPLAPAAPSGATPGPRVACGAARAATQQCGELCPLRTATALEATQRITGPHLNENFHVVAG